MTIAENLATYAKDKPKLQPVSGKVTLKCSGEIVFTSTGSGRPAESKVSLLSGGQRQALTLLMATIVKPKLLLLDEHIAALDLK